MKNVLITGADGFIGKNLFVRMQQDDNIKVSKFTLDNSPQELEQLILEADFIYHLAGVNRPTDVKDFSKHNKDLTIEIIRTLQHSNLKTPLLITSSTQAALDNPYGESKLAAEEAVFEWSKESGSPVYVYRLPGVFGKWAKPNYNSVVATFCYNIAHDKEIEISDPKHEITLAYIDDVVEQFYSIMSKNTPSPEGLLYISPTFTLTLAELSNRIYAINKIRQSLVIPDLSDDLNKYLYATFLSYLPTNNFSYNLSKNTDNRGWLAEFIKSDYFGQIFISKTKPGVTRGDHWHHTKIEKFLVIEGDAEINFRNILNEDKEIITYKVSGRTATVVDIPPGYTHSITNTGKSDLITLFWANEIFNNDRPDTIYEKVKKGDEDE